MTTCSAAGSVVLSGVIPCKHPIERTGAAAAITVERQIMRAGAVLPLHGDARSLNSRHAVFPNCCSDFSMEPSSPESHQPAHRRCAAMPSMMSVIGATAATFSQHVYDRPPAASLKHTGSAHCDARYIGSSPHVQRVGRTTAPMPICSPTAPQADGTTPKVRPRETRLSFRMPQCAAHHFTNTAVLTNIFRISINTARISFKTVVPTSREIDAHSSRPSYRTGSEHTL